MLLASLQDAGHEVHLAEEAGGDFLVNHSILHAFAWASIAAGAAIAAVASSISSVRERETSCQKIYQSGYLDYYIRP